MTGFYMGLNFNEFDGWLWMAALIATLILWIVIKVWARKINKED